MYEFLILKYLFHQNSLAIINILQIWQQRTFQSPASTALIPDMFSQNQQHNVRRIYIIKISEIPYNTEHLLYVQMPTKKAHTNHPGNVVIFLKIMSSNL